MMRTFTLSLACLCIGLVQSLAGQTIDTFPSWDGVNDLDRWGSSTSSDTPTYGQSFTATASLNTLNAVTFSMSRQAGTSVLNYQVYVYAWTGSDITGSSLFQSATVTSPDSDSQTMVKISTGAILLTPNQQYVVFFSTNGILGNPAVGYDWALQGTSLPSAADVYSGGNSVFNNDSSTLFAGNWLDAANFGADPGADLAFRLDFAANVISVPEPTSIALICVSLSLIGLKVYRRLNVKDELLDKIETDDEAS